MCSPRPSPTAPQTITIADRNAELTRLSNDLTIQREHGSNVKAAVVDAQIKNVLKLPVDISSAIYARTGTPGQTVSPSASSYEVAPSVLQGTLAKRATSTLRIPTTPPATTQKK